MDIRFTINENDWEALLAPESEAMLNAMTAIEAADLAKDVMEQAIALYDEQVARLHALFEVKH